MPLKICNRCFSHYHAAEGSCPHCAPSVRRPSLATLAMLGLSLTACAEKEDTGEEPAETAEPSMEMDYGVPEYDMDGDGWSDMEDCNDEDANTYPGAGFNEENPELCMTDADGDGYGAMEPADGASAGTDCDDGDASIHPGADDPEDDIDQNCDGTN